MDNFAGVGYHNVLGGPCLCYSVCERGSGWWKGVREAGGSKRLHQRAAGAVPGCPEEHCMRGSPCCLVNRPCKACVGFEVCSEAFPGR